MADITADIDTPPAKGSKLKLVVPLLMAILAAAGAYIAAGRLLAPTAAHVESPQQVTTEDASTFAVAFVPLDPMTVSLDGSRMLRFSAQVEVAPGSEQDVAALMPRMIDVLQDYLRAVAPEDLSRSGMLNRLRSQMLRRLQIVAGPDRVRDLLIMEFVLN